MKRIAPALLAALVLSACATLPPPSVDAEGVTWLALGQSANIGGPVVTPVKVLEDSRCPINARCVWAGRVRLQVKVKLGSGTALREVASDKALPLADGSLELVDVQPGRMAGAQPENPGPTRFGLRFQGGL